MQNEQLNSSTAQQPNSRAINFLALALITLAAVGCDGALSAGTADRTVAGSSNTRTAIDAGVVFVDCENYLCLRFEQLGLAVGDAVTTVTSSCECVQPSVVSYRSPQGRDANAVLLLFVKEDRKDTPKTELELSSDSVINPVNLGVLIDVKLADGSVRQFTVNLLHTSLAQEVAP